MRASTHTHTGKCDIDTIGGCSESYKISIFFTFVWLHRNRRHARTYDIYIYFSFDTRTHDDAHEPMMRSHKNVKYFNDVMKMSQNGSQ
jgi:hypothetical protein